MNIKEIIQRLQTAMNDARGQESHFESWLTQNEGICDAIDALKELDKTEQEPVAWMLEGWGPDCGPYFEIYRNDEMGWRDKKEWTPLYTTPYVATPRPQRKPLTKDDILAIGGVVAHDDVFFINIKQLNQLVGIKE